MYSVYLWKTFLLGRNAFKICQGELKTHLISIKLNIFHFTDISSTIFTKNKTFCLFGRSIIWESYGPTPISPISPPMSHAPLMLSMPLHSFFYAPSPVKPITFQNCNSLICIKFEFFPTTLKALLSPTRIDERADSSRKKKEKKKI